MLGHQKQRLYHIATAPDWDRARQEGEYRTSTRGRTLSEEGFIHASTAAQVLPVANAVYLDEQQDLVLLVLDTSRIAAEIRREPVPGWADPFPHIYGPLNVDAVVRAVPLERDAAGSFRWPAGLARL
jgi:glutathione S-transferase